MLCPEMSGTIPKSKAWEKNIFYKRKVLKILILNLLQCRLQWIRFDQQVVLSIYSPTAEVFTDKNMTRNRERFSLWTLELAGCRTAVWQSQCSPHVNSHLGQWRYLVDSHDFPDGDSETPVSFPKVSWWSWALPSPSNVPCDWNVSPVPTRMNQAEQVDLHASRWVIAQFPHDQS